MRFKLSARLTLHRSAVLGFAFLIFAASVACATVKATPASAPVATPGSTAASALVALSAKPELDGVDAFTVLEDLLADLGPRESATEQELGAAKYLESRFRELGYATEVQTFDVEDISLTGKGLTLDTPQPSEFTALPMGKSGLGDVSGVLTPVGLAMLDHIPESGLEGQIAVAKRGIITFQTKAENVFAAGAVGLVVYNNVSGIFRGTLATRPEYPVISLSKEDGEVMEALLSESEIQASIALTLKNLPSRNVIAEKKGPGDAVVVLGGHYDTVSGLSGANDNASGISVLLAVAQILAEDNLPFTLRIIPFGSEELGLLGSNFYVESLSDEELDQTKAMLNFDALGTGTGVSIFGHRDLTALASAVGSEIGVEIAVTRGVTAGTSDYASFQAAGVPTLMYYGDDFSRIHTEDDTIEFVQPELVDGATAVAVALLRSEEFADLIKGE